MILPCHCKSAYQDEAHGPGLRVHTPKKDGDYRCTICSTVRNK